MQADKELHLMIVWDRGMGMKNTILEDLGRLFKVLMVYDMGWSEKNFAKNLSRFYGKKLWDVGAKVRECGTGNFLLITFLDESPVYADRETNSGQQHLNTNIFDLKQKYRGLGSGSFSVHATNSPEETRRDLFLLLGVTYEKYVLERSGWAGAVVDWPLDSHGLDGFSSLKDAFALLNQCAQYVVLRDYEELLQAGAEKNRRPIELLVASRDEVAGLLCAEKVSVAEHCAKYFVFINNEKVFFALRCVGDRYYDAAFQTSILHARVYDERGFYCPAESDYAYALLYHVLIHNLAVAAEHKFRLSECFTTEASSWDAVRMSEVLSGFMLANRYKYTLPLDRSLSFNEENIVSAALVDKPAAKKILLSDVLLLKIKMNGWQVRILPKYIKRSVFRLYFSLGGIFKVDFSVGRVREL